MTEASHLTDKPAPSSAPPPAKADQISLQAERHLRFDSFTALTYGLAVAAILCQVLLLAAMG